MIDSLLIAILTVVLGILSLYKWVIIIHALLSWVRPDPYNPIVQMIERLTQPSYQFVRSKIPTTFGGMDIAPIIIIFTIIFIETFLTSLFMH